MLPAVVVFCSIGCRTETSQGITVVASTANVSAIVKAVGGGRVSVTTVAPAGMCPGHFDVRPSDIAAVNRSELLLNQGWEEWLPDLESAIENPRLTRVTAQTKGNWMLPAVHKRAVLEVFNLLAGLDSAFADTFRIRAESYSARVDSAWTAARSTLQGKDLPAVLAADRQALFLRALGFEVAATYGRPEDFSARELSRLAQVGVDKDVGLVVDNLQSGPDAGLELARSLGARHVNLSNFPLDDDYPQTLLDNVRSLALVLE
ncbi:MAG: zinc ABC transporter substrate-binding protein [candidate division WOR-3 bacterium]|nr:MAG: zinc ABC transporter substrate-binding protein [candidate division WOR-3 bacterium]